MRIEQEMRFIAEKDMRIYFGENYINVTPTVINANPAIRVILDSIAFDAKKMGMDMDSICKEAKEAEANNVG